MVGSNFVQQLVGIVDTRFMASLSVENSAPLAAVGFASLVFMIATLMPFAFSMGGQIIVARRAGEGRDPEVGILVDHAVVFFFALGVLIMGLLLWFMPSILGSVLQSEEVAQLTMDYLQWRAGELPIAAVLYALFALYTGVGRPKPMFTATVILTTANIVLNYGLIFGRLGLPRMEIAGAGLASLLAHLLATGFLLVHAFRSDMRPRYRYFEWLAFEPGLLRRLTTLSGPMVVQFLLGSTVWMYFFTRLERMGEDALAISNVVKLLYMALATTTWGLGGAVNTMVSNLMGQGRPEDVLLVVRQSVFVGFGMALVGAALLLAFPTAWLQAFTVDRPDLVAMGIGPLRLTGFALLLMAVSVTLFRTVTGLGATGYSLLSECLAVPFYLLYVELVIVRGEMGLTWAWGSEFVYWGVTGLACWAYLRWGRWRDITF